MTSHPFTLRSNADLLATFKERDQKHVVFPKFSPYPFLTEHYYTWTEPSQVYTYLVYKQSNWETPLGIVFQRNGSGHTISPSGMCDWCHSQGPSNEIGLMSTEITARLSGGTWLCLELDCLQKIEEQTSVSGRHFEKRRQNLFRKIGEFYQRVRINP